MRSEYDKICDEYSNVAHYSATDVYLTVYAMLFVKMKNHIPMFFGHLNQNQRAVRPQMNQLYYFIADIWDKDIGLELTINLSMYMWQLMPDFDKGSIELVKATVVRSNIAVQVPNGEKLDHENFFIGESKKKKRDPKKPRWDIGHNVNFHSSDEVASIAQAYHEIPHNSGVGSSPDPHDGPLRETVLECRTHLFTEVAEANMPIDINVYKFNYRFN